MRGFTLIETIIYLALFSVVITSAVMGLYSITTHSSATQQAATISNEGAFMIQKIHYGIETGGITLRLHDSAIEMRGEGGDYIPLTTKNVTAEALGVTPIMQGSEEVGSETSFTLSGTVFLTRDYLP